MSHIENNAQIWVYRVIGGSVELQPEPKEVHGISPRVYSYPPGSIVQATAKPDADHKFLKWRVDQTWKTANPLSITLADPGQKIRLVAHFRDILTITIQTSNGGITDPTPGIYELPFMDWFTVTAVPFEGFAFSHWTVNDEIDRENPLRVWGARDVTVKPHFSMIDEEEPPTPPDGEPPTPPTPPTACLLMAIFGSSFIAYSFPYLRLFRDLVLPHFITNGYYQLSTWILRMVHLVA